MSIALRPRIGIDNVRHVDKYLTPQGLIFCDAGVLYRGWFIRRHDLGGSLFRLRYGKQVEDGWDVTTRQSVAPIPLRVVGDYLDKEPRIRYIHLPRVDQYWRIVHRLRAEAGLK